MDEGRNRRVWERLAYDKGLLLVMADGTEVTGESRDVSLTGVFLASDRIPATILVGHMGMLHVATGAGYDDSFPCEVRRVAENGLALFITERAAQFAMILSQDIFEGWARKGRKTGTK